MGFAVLEYFTLSFVYQLAKDGYARFRGTQRRLSPSEVLELRTKWKPQFEKYIWENYSKKLRSDVIIRDVKRLDKYPDIDENEKGISPWFRLGLVGTYHRGIYVAHGWGGLVKDGEGWRYPDYKSGERGEVKVLLIGSIPYENIEQVDWNGDEYYGYPHIYCWFNNKKEPYEHTGIYEKHEPITDGALPWFKEIADVEEVRRRSKARGLEGYFG
jgi:hypothetical protein